MDLQINRWGNSLAMRLPAVLAKNLGVHDGSSLSTQELAKRLLALDEQPPAAKALQARRRLLASLEDLHRTLPVTRPIPKEELSRY